MPEANITRRSAVSIAALLLTLSASFIAFGTKPKTITPIVHGAAFEVGGTVVTWVGLIMCSMALVTAAVATVLLRKTDMGVLLRALAERPTTAELLGVPSRMLTIGRSEEHTSELQSLMSISYAVFCLTKQI